MPADSELIATDDQSDQHAGQIRLGSTVCAIPARLVADLQEG